MIIDKISFENPLTPFEIDTQFIKRLTLMGLEQSHLFKGPWIDYRHIANSNELDKIIHSHGLQELGLTQIRLLIDKDKRAGWCADIYLKEEELLVRWVQGGQPLGPTSTLMPIFGGRGSTNEK